MNEYLYQFLLENTPFILVKNGVVVNAGDRLLEDLGYDRKEIIGLHVLELLDLITRNPCSVPTGTDQATVWLLNKKGEAALFHIRICEHLSSHTILYILERKESLIKQDLNTIHQLISNSPFGMAVFSVPDIILLNANQSWLSRLDEPFNRKEASIGKPISEIMTGWKGNVFENLWDTVMKSGKACHMPEYRYSGLKKGISFWNISMTPIFEQGKLAYFVEITYDVTETVMNRDKIKMQKDQLFRQFQQFETVVENMSDALFIIYPDFMTLSLNPEAHAIKNLFNNFQYQIEPSDQMRYYDSQDNEIPYHQLPIFKILKGEQLKAFRATVKTPDNVSHFSISGRPVYDNQNDINFSIVCIRDVTNQVNQDNLVLKVEKEKKEYLERAITLKDNFLTLISHEFKTPLTVIGTAIQAIELFCGEELSHKANRYIAMIKQNSLRQLRLVSNLLDITRGTADQIRLNKRNIDIVMLTRMITESVKIYAAQKNLQISFETNVDSKLVSIDDEKVERIILNILSNAIKFTPKGKNVYVRLLIEEGFINISVKDEGVGIPQDKVNLVFERFGQVDSSFSRQAEGSGIGLYLVKMFVERMGGTVSVESVPYTGATFSIKLPDTPAEDVDSDVYDDVDNKKIISRMNIEFSDIYFSK